MPKLAIRLQGARQRAYSQVQKKPMGDIVGDIEGFLAKLDPGNWDITPQALKDFEKTLGTPFRWVNTNVTRPVEQLSVMPFNAAAHGWGDTYADMNTSWLGSKIAQLTKWSNDAIAKLDPTNKKSAGSNLPDINSILGADTQMGAMSNYMMIGLGVVAVGMLLSGGKKEKGKKKLKSKTGKKNAITRKSKHNRR